MASVVGDSIRATVAGGSSWDGGGVEMEAFFFVLIVIFILIGRHDLTLYIMYLRECLNPCEFRPF